MDKELERRGHKFVRYADDFSIYCTSQRGAERLKTSLTTFIEEVLHLKINEGKSGIRRPSKMVLLGFGFYTTRKGRWGFRLAPKTVIRLKEKIKKLTQRREPLSTIQRVISLKSVQQGWLNYFRIADCKTHLERIDEWTRRRLRMCEWKLWKRVRTRTKRLTELGIAPNQAYQWANTRKGYWHTANSPILTRSLTNEWFKSEGYVSLSELDKRYKARS